MTPAPAPDEKCYIITESDIDYIEKNSVCLPELYDIIRSREINGYFITRTELEEVYDALASINGKEYADKVWDIVEKRNVYLPCSRPYASAPELYNVTLKTESEIAADRLNVAAYERGKSDGAKAEREKVLKEAHELNTKRFCPSMVDTHYHCCDVMTCLDEIFESLRSQEREQGIGRND